MITLTDYDRKVYQTELKPFLPKEFIDCHVHIWQKDFPAQGAHNGGATWTDKVSEDLSAEQLLQGYKILFPDNVVTPLVFGSCLKHIPTCNDYVKDNADKYGFPTLFRTSYDMTPDYLETEVKKGGFLGLAFFRKMVYNGRSKPYGGTE
jgi:putative component of membrane protein insertase Oxa1/YidC/SpoIIIJ protein YidD